MPVRRLKKLFHISTWHYFSFPFHNSIKNKKFSLIPTPFSIFSLNNKTECLEIHPHISCQDSHISIRGRLGFPTRPLITLFRLISGWILLLLSYFEKNLFVNTTFVFNLFQSVHLAGIKENIFFFFFLAHMHSYNWVLNWMASCLVIVFVQLTVTSRPMKPTIWVGAIGVWESEQSGARWWLTVWLPDGEGSAAGTRRSLKRVLVKTSCWWDFQFTPLHTTHSHTYHIPCHRYDPWTIPYIRGMVHFQSIIICNLNEGVATFPMSFHCDKWCTLNCYNFI